jgi:phenylalanyl-tRNA synthetase alpha chain
MSRIDINQEILLVIDSQGRASSLSLAEQLSVDHQAVVGAIKSLQCLGDVIKSEQCESKRWELTREGEEMSERGSHEAIVWQNVPHDGIEQSALLKTFDDPNVGKVGFSKAMSNKWINIDKNNGKPIVKRKVDKIEDEVQVLLNKIKDLKLNEVS